MQTPQTYNNIFPNLILLSILLVAIISGHRMSHAPAAPETTQSSDGDMDFRVFNRLAVQMDGFHSILRNSWNQLYAGTAPQAKKPSAAQLISLGMHFCQHLKGHHDIEETYWFPVLGKKMEGFRPGHFATTQHREMHKGLDRLMPYLTECRSGQRDFRREEVREIMDSFGAVLWTHLDDEVKELGGENMRKFWTKAEMQRMPF